MPLNWKRLAKKYRQAALRSKEWERKAKEWKEAWFRQREASGNAAWRYWQESELWKSRCLGSAYVAPSSISQVSWPEFDPELVKEETVKIAVQINGKVRGTVEIATNMDEVGAREAALAAVASHLEGKTIKKMVYVPGRIINFVV